MVYDIIQNYNTTYNSENIISLYSDQYIYSGGANGITTRTSQNWNMQCGKFITLNDLFFNKSNYILDILKNINNQISQNPEFYFDNYCSLVLQNFKTNQFYITSKNTFCTFFQMYDIAPHSTGIPYFCMNY